jgi:hypothetical protein
MNTKFVKALLRNTLATAAVVLSGAAVAATTTVNLTAQQTSITLPDGAVVPMWGYCDGSLGANADLTAPAGSATAVACSSTAWSVGPTITVPAGSDLVINLTNNLPMPTSVVVLGQLGGGLGAPSRILDLAQHAPQTTTSWPGNGGATFTPPAQLARVMSMATEVPANIATALPIWSNLKAGTYLYETGTLPSIQAPMGLYGVLIVTHAPVAADPTTGLFVPGKAYPGNTNEVAYDADVALLFSEIDPVQNKAVNAAAVAGADVKMRFDDAACASIKCYPAAVNYTPTYFLINGKSYDTAHPEYSAFPIPATAATGNVLIRFLNAGLRSHIPAIFGLPMSIVAEDGNLAPSKPKVQNEVLLTAGKTHDALVSPASASGAYSPKAFAVFDRQLSLSAANQLGSGMQAFLQVNAGALPTANTPSKVMPTAVADMFPVPLNTSINGNVRTNDIAVANAAVVTQPANGTLSFYSDGSFVYTPNPNFTGPDTFTYNGNNGTSSCSDGTTVLPAPCSTVVTLNVGNAAGGAGAPIANNDTYGSKLATRFVASQPGVLANDTDPNSYVLTAAQARNLSCGSVTLNSNGSFTATKGASSSCQFTYTAVNSKNVASDPTAPATVTVNFPTASGLTVNVIDPATNTAITDYRWIIQEDLTFKVDATGTPSLATRTLGTSFHKSHMPVVASGCVGDNSCGVKQTVRGVTADLQAPTLPDEVALDPTKNYYISILPGDAGAGGHAMGGTEIKSGWTTPPSVTVNSNAYGYVPSQLSVFIYEDNAPVNNQNDLNETGLGGFNIILMDAVGRSGDVAGQQTYDAYGMPLSNWLLGRPGCPDDRNKNTNAPGNPNVNSVTGNVVGVVYTCPNAPDRGPAPTAPTAPSPNPTSAQTAAYQTALAAYQTALVAYNAQAAQDAIDYALAGHALIQNLTPARYDVIAHPGAARQGMGEVWWQVETLEGTPAQDAFNGIKEPRYFQEFGPPGFHTTIGFVNPDRVKKYAVDNGLVGNKTITGKITNQHMSRPSNATLYDSGSYDLLSSTTCQVALNSQGGTGPAIAIAQCARDGSFILTKVPAGAYELAIWDQWLDQIIQSEVVIVNPVDTTVAMGNIPVLSWFTQYDQNIFMESSTKPTDQRGIYRQDLGDKGISNVTMTTRYRDGGISNQTATDSNGNGLLAELFPLFNWYVTEADTTRFKQSGVNVIVDAGGKTDTSGDGTGLWNSVYQATAAHPTGCTPDGYPTGSLGPDCPAANSTSRVEIPGAYSYGLQGFISQRNTINWGRVPYAAKENGGIQGVVVYSTTRPFDDQRYNVQTLWEPLVPRVTVNLYRKGKTADGTETLTLVDSTLTSSWDDYVNSVDLITGKQVNMQCPGQRPDDPFYMFTLAGNDQFRCYDGWHNWNQVQAAPYDGRYQFPSAVYIAAHASQIPAGGTLVTLPTGQYVVEAVTPAGYQIVKEEDKNILNGDSFVAPVVTQFAGIGNVFILPDQATLNNDNPYNLKTADGIRNNATTNLGATSSQLQFPECVGTMHRVPDYLSLFPSGGLVAPFAGMDRPLCDRKLVSLNDQQQASANFFVFTEVPTAAAGTGIILDDATSEFNAAAPDFGEKASVPFVPVSIKDFNGREVGRSISDQWGAYNVMTPSSWLVNPPTPSGYGPNMLVTCINDPGPIPDPTGAIDPATRKVRMITDPQYNAGYSNFCYTLPFMPGRTTYLDTPVLPVAAFAAGYNPADCEYPDLTPAISRVDAGAVPTATNFGPYLPTSGGTLTITALGDRQVPNPAYAGPFAISGPASVRALIRHYGFGAAKGTVTVGKVIIPASSVTWSDLTITVNVPGGTPTGTLVVTNAAGKSTVDAVTVTLEDKAPIRVQASAGATIQAAIDAATPGDLIMIDGGVYNELVVMWKPVRLQGVGAASVVINAAKYPTTKLDVWRPTINAMFGIDTITGNQSTIGTQVDPLPGQEVTGGVVLLEPSVLGTEEGAGITVLAKGLNALGQPLTNTPADCAYATTKVAFDLVNGANTIPQPGLSNFLCAPSRIDGVSVTGGDAGGGIYVNGWAHNLEIANNRVYGNAGALHGGVRVGVPYLETTVYPGQTVDPITGAVVGLPTLVGGSIAGLGYDNNVRIHHNAITKNGTVEGPAGNGGAGGGVSICTGSDGYSVDHNWICGNYSSSDGGGVGHIGYSQNGSISYNSILFNQTFQQTNSTHGGGIIATGEPPIVGTLSLGTGNLKIDANLIRGNFAEAGSGGGVRLQQVNGAEAASYPGVTNLWFSVTATNNMIVNNVAGYAGGGIALADALVSVVENNTVASNDSVGIAGVVLTASNGTANQSGIGRPSPAGVSSDPTSAALVNALASVENAVLPNSKKRISNPYLANNIVWHNRSFYYKAVAGVPTLCPSNNGASTACAPLPTQTLTGQCTGSPAYWDLGVVGDVSATPGELRLSPVYSILTSTVGYGNNGTTHNANTNPTLLDLYCNGSRVTPEFPGVINPPSVKTMQVAATLDEGNNYVNLRYGPLTTMKPTTAAGTAYVAFGDYHIAATSPAVNTGTSELAPNHDYDGQSRPQGAGFDKGADEIVVVGGPFGAPSVTPLQLDFGYEQVGAPSAYYPAKIVTLRNVGTGLLTGIDFSVTGGAGDFAIVGRNCAATLAAGASCTISIAFVPSNYVGRAGFLNVTTADATNPLIQVSLTGIGTHPMQSVAPVTLAFTSQLINTTSVSQPVVVTNTGYGPLPIASITFTGGGAARYSQTNDCPAAIALGSFCTINVSFRPTVTGNAPAANLRIQFAPNTQPVVNQNVTLTGVGAVAALSQSPLNFGLVPPADPTLTAQISNPAGDGALTITSITLTSGAPYFVIAPATSCTAGALVAAGNNCDVTVTFTQAPVTSLAVRRGNVRIVTSAGTFNVPLSGN